MPGRVSGQNKCNFCPKRGAFMLSTCQEDTLFLYYSLSCLPIFYVFLKLCVQRESLHFDSGQSWLQNYPSKVKDREARYFFQRHAQT